MTGSSRTQAPSLMPMSEGRGSCPACVSPDVTVVDIKYPFFRQTDFTTVKSSGAIGQCGSCQVLFQVVDTDDVERIEQQFEDESYAESPQTSQTITAQGFDGPVTRSCLQAQLIGGLVPGEQPSILDVGCFDGELLVELDRLFPGADLHGFDRYEHVRRFFPSRPNFRFWSPDLEAVQGQFDLVSVSHTMMYERDNGRLMGQLKRLLKPGGALFVQMPDVDASPWYLLMADQYYYYTPAILAHTLRRFGFSFSSLETEWFPREIVGAARLGAATEPRLREGGQLHRYIEALDKKAAQLQALVDAPAVGVLGTTGAAAFVDSVCGDNVAYFVDENSSRVGTRFRNKLVSHPQTLQDSDVIVIPYGASGRRVRDRFIHQYRGRFVVV